MELKYHRGATADVRAAIRFYEREQPGLGKEFAATLSRIERQIKALPHAYAKVDPALHKLVMRRFPFSVFYSVQSDAIIILAVAHHRRRPNYWQERTNDMN